MKRYLLRIVAILLASVVLLLWGCGNAGTKNLTKEYFEKNVYKVLSESFKPEDIFGDENPFEALFENTEEFNLTLEHDLNKTLGYNGKLLMEINTDSANNKGSLNLRLDSAVASDIDLMIYADAQKILISSDSFFGEGRVYSIEFTDFEKLKNDFSNSDLATVLGISGDKVQELCDEYGINEEYFKSVSLAVNEYNEYCKGLDESVSKIFKSVYAECPYEITEETININGIDTDALVYGTRLYEGFPSDLKAEYIALYEKYAEKQMDLIEKITPTKLKSNFPTDTEALKPQGDMLDNGTLEAVLEILSGADLKFYLEKDGARLRKIVVDKGEVSFNVYFTDEIKIEMSDGERILSHVSIYHTEDSSVKSYGFEMVSEDNPHERLVGKFEIIKFENRYNLFIRSMYGEDITSTLLESSGRFAYSKSSFEICPEIVSVGYENYYPATELGVGNDSFVMEYANSRSIFEIPEGEIFGICTRAVNVFAGLSPFFTP